MDSMENFIERLDDLIIEAVIKYKLVEGYYFTEMEKI
jgi:hypothetical protein